MTWFEKLVPSRIRTDTNTKRQVPEGLWIKCDACGAILYRAELERNLQVCPKCGHHRRIGARQRLEWFLDPEAFDELGGEVEPTDFLRFRDSRRYRDRLIQAQRDSGERDALVVFKGAVKGIPVVAAAFEFNFMGGSMGAVGGERFVVATKACIAQQT
ncbi:MAG: acetyl-CoA carboxylase carboxyl transferase subunit beta, partial [Candidatus Competibacterales bacterium]